MGMDENLTGGVAPGDMSNAEHQHRHESDQSPAQQRAAKRVSWSLIILFIVVIGLSGLNLWFTANQVNGAEQRSQAACSFWKDLAIVPVSNAQNGWPSQLAISIVAHSREAYRGFGCPGKLPPPSASFIRGANHYGINPS
jgi:hypothetical protein